MRKQRKLKTMKKLLNLIMMPIILFISITTVGCGAKDNYVEGYGEDEYIEYSDSEYYEEPQETKISDKEINKLLKKYPDWRTQPEEFAREAFITDSIIPIDNKMTRMIDYKIVNNINYNSLRYIINPTGMNIVRLDQYESDKKIEKEVLVIEKVKSIFQLDESEGKLNPIYSYFKEYDYSKYSTPYIKHKKEINLYVISLAKIRKNGKTKIIWSKVYPTFTVKYESEIKTNTIWTNEALKDLNFRKEYLKPVINKFAKELALQWSNNAISNARYRINYDYDDIDRRYGKYKYISEEELQEMKISSSNGRITGMQEYFYQCFRTDISNIENDDFDWSSLIGRDTVIEYPVEWTNLMNQYQRKEIINFEGLSISYYNDEIINNLVNEIFDIYVNYTYFGKLPR